MQPDLYVQPNDYWSVTAVTTAAADSLLASELLAAAAALALTIAAVMAILFGFRWYIRYRGRVPEQFRKVVLLITIPKESLKQEQGKEGDRRESITEQIGRAEMLWSAIGGLKAERSWQSWLFGREDHIAVELVAHQGTISFYVAVPSYLQRYVEQQLHAYYPEAFLEEVDDYNIFEPQGVVKAGYIVCKRPFFFPIKTYKRMEVDPLESLTNVLSKLAKHEGAVIQMVAQSAKGSWHRRGSKVVSEMKQGQRLREAIRAASTNPLVKLWVIIEKGFVTKPKAGAEPTKHYQLSQMEEEMAKGIEEKVSKAGLDVNIRVVVSADQDSKAKLYLQNILSSFAQFNIYEYGNSFRAVIPRTVAPLIHDYIHRNWHPGQNALLNTEEAASIFHLPLASTETPNIRWLTARRAAAPLNVPTAGIRLGANTYRGVETVIRIKPEDRRRHMYIVGKSGVGKSWLLANLARQDIVNGEGVCVIDPHGDLIDDILEAIPAARADDVIIFDPADIERPLGL
ncbi:MAG: DUF87 domain-containing protein, partial [Patescibacteria group bacterium]